LIIVRETIKGLGMNSMPWKSVRKNKENGAEKRVDDKNEMKSNGRRQSIVGRGLGRRQQKRGWRRTREQYTSIYMPVNMRMVER